MRGAFAIGTPVLLLLLASCSGGSSASERGTEPPDASEGIADAGVTEAGEDGAAGDASDGAADPADAADTGPQCAPFGAPGQCITVSACAALGDHSSYPGYCPGPSDVECCIDTPDVADNPPVPVGWQLMQQSQVTPAMTSWAVMILNDWAGYPMFSTATQMFGALDVLARVEWHPPDFNNGAVHRGVTLYEPTD